MKKIIWGIVALVVIISGFAWYNGSKTTAENQAKLKNILGNDNTVTVVANSTCGCCKLYMQYLQQLGFNVNSKFMNQDEIDSYKNVEGIPKQLRSCHTTTIGKYTIEGHVPMEAITKLLQEKPDIKGIALPGMPSASPGMPGPKNGPFEIRTITKDGQDGGLFTEI